jgi:hypothetical protein
MKTKITPMSKERELKCWLLLLEAGSMPRSQIPRSVQAGQAFAQLLGADIIGWVRKGSGQVLNLQEANLLRQYVAQHFPEHETQTGGDAFSNARRYRDSKGAAKVAAQVMLLRGQGMAWLNEGAHEVDLGYYTDHFGCFAAAQPRIHTLKPCCIVENLDCFMRAEEVLGPGTIFIHPYGRLGKDSLPGLQAQALWHFGDYDFTGLNDYLNLKAQYPQAQLYMPEGLEALWQKYATPLKAGAVPSSKVKASVLPEVRRVRGLLSTTQRFLEQQVLFPDQNLVL